MPLTGKLKEISTQICGHCKKQYGKHSKKGFMKCLYTANYNLYNAYQELNLMKERNETLDKITVDEFGEVVIDGKKAGNIKEIPKENWTKERRENDEEKT